jgi:hypothetical protein
MYRSCTAATRAVMNSAATTPMMLAVVKSGSLPRYLAASFSDQTTTANVATCKAIQASFFMRGA